MKSEAATQGTEPHRKLSGESDFEPSREVLLEEIPGIAEQFSWARKNLMKCEPGIAQHEKWFELTVHLGLKVIEMQRMAADAPRETKD